MNPLLSENWMYATIYGISLGMLTTVATFIFLFAIYAFSEHKRYSARTFFYTGLSTVFYFTFYLYVINIYQPIAFLGIPSWILILGKIAIPIVIYLNYRTFINSLPVNSLENYAGWMNARKSFRVFDTVIFLSILLLLVVDNHDIVIIISLLIAIFENYLSLYETRYLKKNSFLDKAFDLVLFFTSVVMVATIFILAVYGLKSVPVWVVMSFQMFFACIMVIYSFVLIQNNIRNGAFNEQTSQLIADGFFKSIYRALRDDEFFLLYQPKINLKTGKICGVEALIRWNHPTKGLIPPNEFIPTAEQTTVVNNICEWVILRAVKDVKTLREQGIDIPVSINFSVIDVTQTMVEFLINTLKEHDLPHSCIIIEITESLFLDMSAELLKAIDDIKNANIKLSLDDFGAGYSSVRQLDRLPLGEVKIDRALIDNMANESQSLIVQTLLNMCHVLKIQVVAEGVNDENTIKNLMEMDCEMAQGYGICRPQHLDNLIGWALSNLEENSENSLRTALA